MVIENGYRKGLRIHLLRVWSAALAGIECVDSLEPPRMAGTSPVATSIGSGAVLLVRLVFGDMCTSCF